jgi:hypothetical protein
VASAGLPLGARLQQRLAPNYVRVIFANLSAVLSAAVDDGLIPRNPCRAGSVKPPPPDRSRVHPWPVERVAAARAALPARYAALVDVCAGLGLRQGEAFGLASTTSTSSAASCTCAGR